MTKDHAAIRTSRTAQARIALAVVALCCLLATGCTQTLFGFGRNIEGQLGTGDFTSRSVPTTIDTGWTMVSSGGFHTVAIRGDGTLWQWGRAIYGELGNGSTEADQSTPQQLGTATWKWVSAGKYHTEAIRSDGTLWG